MYLVVIFVGKLWSSTKVIWQHYRKWCRRNEIRSINYGDKYDEYDSDVSKASIIQSNCAEASTQASISRNNLLLYWKYNGLAAFGRQMKGIILNLSSLYFNVVKTSNNEVIAIDKAKRTQRTVMSRFFIIKQKLLDTAWSYK